MFRRKDEDVRYFEEEIMTLYEPVRRFIYTFTKDSVLSYDLAQDTLARAWEKLDTIKTYSNVGGAMMVIAKNSIRNHMRKESKAPEFLPLEETYISAADELCALEVLAREEKRELLELCNKLRPEYTQIIFLRYQYDMCLKEIADILNVNYNTVVSWHNRALDDLRSRMKKNKYF